MVGLTTLVGALLVHGPWAELKPAAAAYPIPPRPLRMLVEEAQIIVTARVRSLESREPGGGARFPDGEAPEWVILAVDQVLKGDPGTRTIEQRNYFMICPAPARYVVGTRVLAFLDRTKVDGEFSTHALSYGAKELDEAGLKIYLERVKEQLALLELPASTKRRAEQVEWLVKCAEHPATRWEGAFEFAPQGDESSDFDQERSSAEQFARDLSEVQRTRLRDAMLTATSFESGEQCLEELFRLEQDPRLLAWLVSRLRAHSDESEDESYADARLDSTRMRLIERIARRDSRREVQELARSFEHRGTSFLDEEAEKKLRAERGRIVRELLRLF